MSLKICDVTSSRASPSRPLAVTRVTYRIVDFRPTKLRVSISASITAVWPGATIEVLARPLVQPHEGLRLRIVIGSDSRFTMQEVVLDLHATGNRAEVMLVLGKKRVGPRGGPHRFRTQPDQQQTPQDGPMKPAESSLPPAIFSILLVERRTHRSTALFSSYRHNNARAQLFGRQRSYHQPP